jgi:hypothetical protein
VSFQGMADLCRSMEDTGKENAARMSQRSRVRRSPAGAYACWRAAECGLTLPSSGPVPAGFAVLHGPLKSNVRRLPCIRRSVVECHPLRHPLSALARRPGALLLARGCPPRQTWAVRPIPLRWRLLTASFIPAISGHGLARQARQRWSLTQAGLNTSVSRPGLAIESFAWSTSPVSQAPAA